MTCDCCNRARLSPAHSQFCPTCLHCGARLIQAIGHLPISRQEVSTRRRQVLTDWIAHGHPEQQLRALAALDAQALAPMEPIAPKALTSQAPITGPVPNTASGRPTPKKRR